MSNVLGQGIYTLENILENLAPGGRKIINQAIVSCSKVKNSLMEF